MLFRTQYRTLAGADTVTEERSENRITTELSFQIKDGSVHQETAVYSQRRTCLRVVRSGESS